MEEAPGLEAGPRSSARVPGASSRWGRSSVAVSICRTPPRAPPQPDHRGGAARAVCSSFGPQRLPRRPADSQLETDESSESDSEDESSGELLESSHSEEAAEDSDGGSGGSERPDEERDAPGDQPSNG